MFIPLEELLLGDLMEKSVKEIDAQVHMIEMITLFWLFFLSAAFVIQLQVPDTNPIASDAALLIAAEDAHALASAEVDENGTSIMNSYLVEEERVQVYRKLKRGIWVDMGFYELIDAYEKSEKKRKVFKFLLKPIINVNQNDNQYFDILHDRKIPGEIQQEVYKRDRGKCRICGSTDNLHFDHILPFSKGGSSKLASNIQLLCARHNFKKGAKFI